MSKLLSDEDREALLDLLYKRYGHHLKGERFVLDGRVEPGLVELQLILERVDGTFRYDMTFYASLHDNAISEAEGRDLVTDFMGYYLDLYFRRRREVLLPLDFQKYPFGGLHVFARGDVTNPLLDALADEIIEKGVSIAPDDPRLTRLKRSASSAKKE